MELGHRSEDLHYHIKATLSYVGELPYFSTSSCSTSTKRTLHDPRQHDIKRSTPSVVRPRLRAFKAGQRDTLPTPHNTMCIRTIFVQTTPAILLLCDICVRILTTQCWVLPHADHNTFSRMRKLPLSYASPSQNQLAYGTERGAIQEIITNTPHIEQKATNHLLLKLR